MRNDDAPLPSGKFTGDRISGTVCPSVATSNRAAATGVATEPTIASTLPPVTKRRAFLTPGVGSAASSSTITWSFVPATAVDRQSMPLLVGIPSAEVGIPNAEVGPGDGRHQRFGDQPVGRAHVGDARHADQARHASRTAPDHGAVQHRDDRHAAELDLLERGMPGARVQHASAQLKDRILFGSDYALITPERWTRDFAEVGFKDDVRPLILKRNAKHLLGLV